MTMSGIEERARELAKELVLVQDDMSPIEWIAYIEGVITGALLAERQRALEDAENAIGDTMAPDAALAVIAALKESP